MGAVVVAVVVRNQLLHVPVPCEGEAPHCQDNLEAKELEEEVRVVRAPRCQLCWLLHVHVLVLEGELGWWLRDGDGRNDLLDHLILHRSRRLVHWMRHGAVAKWWRKCGERVG